MMKKHKLMSRLLATLLVVALFAACGSPAPAPAPTPGTATDGGQGAAAAGDVTEVTIGLLAPLSGGVAHFGNAVHNGAMLYINEFNARGGLQINVIPFDEEGNETLALTGYHHLYDQGVTAILGSVTSGPTMAVVPEAYADGMPMITATATHANVTVDAVTGQVWSNMFRSCFIDPFQGLKMAEFASQEVGASTAAILYANDIDYSIGLMRAFVERAQELGLEIVATERFANEATSLHSQLTNIAAQNPDVLFFPAYIRHVLLLGDQAREVGLDTTFLGADGWNGVLEAIPDPSTIEGSFFMSGFSDESDDPMVQNFIRNFTAATGNPPDMFGAQAYDAAMILVAALQGAVDAGLEPGSREFRDAVIANMAATDITGVTGHITFDEFNNPQKTAFILQIVDGVSSFWGTF